MKIADKNTKAVDLVREALAKAKQFEDYHCFISMNEARALEKAREIDEKIAKGEKVGRLAGVPYALKDNYLSPEGVTTAAAKMLDNFPAPITATAVKRIEDEGAIMIGRTNLDAYAHGSSTENSYLAQLATQLTKNASLVAQVVVRPSQRLWVLLNLRSVAIRVAQFVSQLVSMVFTESNQPTAP